MTCTINKTKLASWRTLDQRTQITQFQNVLPVFQRNLLYSSKNRTPWSPRKRASRGRASWAQKQEDATIYGQGWEYNAKSSGKGWEENAEPLEQGNDKKSKPTRARENAPPAPGTEKERELKETGGKPPLVEGEGFPLLGATGHDFTPRAPSELLAARQPYHDRTRTTRPGVTGGACSARKLRMCTRMCT